MKKKDSIENPDSMIDKIVLIANLYYKSKLSQQEIAKKLNISRPWVSKLLARAEELEIVKIEVTAPFTNNSELEHALMEKYGIQHVSAVKTDDTAKDYVALAAANYFISHLKPKDVIGVGWGNAVSRFVSELHPIHSPDAQIVPLAGSFGNTFDILPNYNTIQLAETIGGTANVLHTPATCSSLEEYETLMNNEHTRSLIHMAEHADILLVGIGVFETSIMPKYGILNPDEIAALKKKHAIGDVGLQYLDVQGNPVDIDATRRMIKADIFKASKNSRITLGIAEGLNKIDIIHVALSLKLINAFFTDEQTAIALLEKES